MIYGEKNEIVSFGDWVRKRRKALGLTQKALAEGVGCAVVTIKKIERDERRPSRQVANLLADQLAIPKAMQHDFLQMAHGQFVPSNSFVDTELRPPAFLQNNSPLSGKEQPQFVARELELARLENHLKSTLTGNGQVVFILGEAGCGKTRLMEEFARRAQETHPELIVASGSCNAQAGIGDPYLPFRDVMNMLAGDLETKWLAGNISREQVLRLWSLLPHTIQAITEYGPSLIDTLIPGMTLIRRISLYISDQPTWLERFQAVLEKQESQSLNIEQTGLLEQVMQVLRSLATQRPLLLLLDDLQWIDDASRKLLFHLGRRLSGSRILILGAYRSSDISVGRRISGLESPEQHPLDPVISEFKREFGDVEIDLDQSKSGGRNFVDALLDSEPNLLGETFRDHLFKHTKGNPLFTVETLRSMQERRSLIQNKVGQWVEGSPAVPYQLPLRVEAVIEQRVNRLDEPLLKILTVASVEGEVFTAQIIARTLKMEEREILYHLGRDLGGRHRLVREHSEESIVGQRLDRYQFSHVLFQEYLYQRLGPGERRLFHREVAEALENIFEEQTDEIITILLHQNIRMNTSLDRPYPECLTRFGPALVHHFWQGEEWMKAASYAICMGVAAMRTYALREAIDYLELAQQALDKTPDPPQELIYEATLRWVEAAFKFQPYTEQLHRLERAERIARELKDKPGLIRALHWRSNVHLARGLWMRAGPALMECLALADEVGDERLSVRPVYFKALTTTFLNPRESLVLLEQAIYLARKYKDRHVEIIALGTEAQMHAQLGKFEQAHELLQQTYNSLRRTDSPLTESDVDLATAWTYLAMNDAKQGLEYGQRSVEKAIAIDNMDCICYGFDCIGYGNLEMQHVAEAAQAFEEAIERSKKSGAVIPRLMGKAGLAMAQFYSGRVEAMQDLEKAMTRLKRFDNHVGAANAARMLGICLIQVGNLERAKHFLDTACDFYRQTEMYPSLIRTLRSLAKLLEKLHRSSDAQQVKVEVEKLMQESFTNQI